MQGPCRRTASTDPKRLSGTCKAILTKCLRRMSRCAPGTQPPASAFRFVKKSEHGLFHGVSNICRRPLSLSTAWPSSALWRVNRDLTGAPREVDIADVAQRSRGRDRWLGLESQGLPLPGRDGALGRHDRSQRREMLRCTCDTNGGLEPTPAIAGGWHIGASPVQFSGCSQRWRAHARVIDRSTRLQVFHLLDRTTSRMCSELHV